MHYDIAIIGGGPEATPPFTQVKTAKVALIEKGELGEHA